MDDIEFRVREVILCRQNEFIGRYLNGIVEKFNIFPYVVIFVVQ